MGKCCGILGIDIRIGKYVVAVVAWCKGHEPKVLLYEVEHVALLYAFDILGPVTTVVVQTVQARHNNADGILRTADIGASGRVLVAEHHFGKCLAVALGDIYVPHFNGSLA